MDIEIELIVVAKVLFAAILGCIIGYEREKDHKSAGIRTFGAVSAGAALFTAIAINYTDANASARVIANIITGVGFLGAGIIYKNSKTKEANGLTTAANVWAVSAIGVATALSFYVIAICTTLLLYGMLSFNNVKFYSKWRNKIKKENGKPKKKHQS